jgi:hypothetical protein
MLDERLPFGVLEPTSRVNSSPRSRIGGRDRELKTMENVFCHSPIIRASITLGSLGGVIGIQLRLREGRCNFKDVSWEKLWKTRTYQVERRHALEISEEFMPNHGSASITEDGRIPFMKIRFRAVD